MLRQSHPAHVVGTPNHPLQVARALVKVLEGTVPAEVGLREGTLGALERHLPAVARRPGGAGRRPGLVGDELWGGETRGEHGRASSMAMARPQRPTRQATGERQTRHQKHKRSGQKRSRVAPPSWTCASPTNEAVELLRPPKQGRFPAQHEPGARIKTYAVDVIVKERLGVVINLGKCGHALHLQLDARLTVEADEGSCVGAKRGKERKGGARRGTAIDKKTSQPSDSTQPQAKRVGKRSEAPVHAAQRRAPTAPAASFRHRHAASHRGQKPPSD